MAELANRDQLEARFARRLAKVFARHRRELIALLGYPPDAKNVPESFWKRAEKETEDETFALLLIIFSQSMVQHGFSGNGAALSAEGWAATRAKEVASSITDTSRETLAYRSAEWEVYRERARAGELEVPTSRGTVRQDTLDIFGPKRVAGIAENETTAARHQGAEAAIEATVGLSEDDIWHTAEDRKVCPTCEPLDMKPRSFWSRFFPNGPPDPHTRCRCFVEHVNLPRGEMKAITQRASDGRFGTTPGQHFGKKKPVSGSGRKPADAAKPSPTTATSAPTGMAAQAAAIVGGKIKKTDNRAFSGEPVPIKNVLSKQMAGAIGEEVCAHYLRSKGFSDAKPLSQHMKSSRNNLPADLIQDHKIIEVKAGQASNGEGAQQWRLTIGEPGKKEKEWLKRASPEAKAKFNAKKQAAITERKKAAIAEVSKELGYKVGGSTMTVIINHDTRTADIYHFDGFHDRIGWKSPEAAKGYVGSFKYGK